MIKDIYNNNRKRLNNLTLNFGDKFEDFIIRNRFVYTYAWFSDKSARRFCFNAYVNSL